MEINNPSFQELSAPTSQLSEIESENEMSRELNDSELDAIAGGCGIPTITVDPSQVPQSLISERQNIINKYSRLFG